MTRSQATEPLGRTLQRRGWMILGVLALFACDSAGSSGCAGCGTTTPYPANAPAVENGVQVRLSRPGLDFLESNIDPLISEFAGGGLDFCVPESSGPDLCYERQCSDGSGTGCDLGITIDDVRIAAVDPGTLEVTIVIGGLFQAEDFIEVDLFGFASECIVRLGTQNDAGLPVKLRVAFTVDPSTRDVALALASEEVEIDFNALDIEIDGRDIEDFIVCEGVDFLADLSFIQDILFSTIQDQLGGFIDPLVSDFLCRKCDTAADCAQGDTCVEQDGNNVCWNAAQERCAPLILGIEGAVDFGALVASVSPGLEAELLYQIKAHGYADARNQGMSLGVRGGTWAEKAECVPTVPPPSNLVAPRSTVLEGNLRPDGQPFHLGLGVHEYFLDEALWGVFNSGGLCLAVGTSTSDFISTGTFATLLPSLRELTGGANSPMIIQLAPQQPPTIDVGAGTLDPNTGAIVDPLLTLRWSNLDLHFLAFFNERYVRLFTLNTDLVVPLGLDATPEGIIPVIGDLTDAFARLDVRSSELLTEPPTLLQELIPSIVSLALPLLGDSLSSPIELPEIQGFRLVVDEGSFAGIENNTMLGLFLRLEAAPPGMNLDALPPLETAARIVEVRLPEARLMRPVEGLSEEDRLAALWASRPRVEVEAQALFGGQPVEGEAEFSWRLDGGLWSPFQADPLLVVDGPLLLLQGHHSLEVRARRRGEVGSLDRTPAEVAVIIDVEPPRLALERQGAQVLLRGEDAVSRPEALRYAVRVDGGAWSAPEARDVIDLDALAEGVAGERQVKIEVKVLDEAGHEALETATFAVHGRVSRESGSSDGCDCAQVGPRSGGSPLLALLLMGAGGLGVAFWRRRRGRGTPKAGAKALAVLGLLGAFLASGCEDDAPPVTGQTVACPEFCPSGEVCRRGACVADGSCELEEDCTGGRQCVEGLCVEIACASSAECPVGEACVEDRQGNVVCAAVSCEADAACGELNCGPRPAVCDGGTCACEAWCSAGCGEMQLCCQQDNTCRDLASPCEGFPCDPGFAPVITTPPTGDPKSCQVAEAGACACEALPPLPEGSIGRYLDAVEVGGVIYVSAYNETYGDLMVGRVGADDAITWWFVDGVPTGAPVVGQIDGPRGGIRDRGDDVGRFTSIAATAAGELLVTYRDETHRDLKLAIGQPGAGGFTWTFQVIDATGDVGLWGDLSLGSDGLPAVAYLAPGAQADAADPAATSGLRWAQAAGSVAAGFTWTITELDTQPAAFYCDGGCGTTEKCRADTNTCARSLSAGRCNDACGEGEGCFEDGCAPLAPAPPALRELPEAAGLYARVARFSSGDAAIVYYDRVGGDLRFIRQEAGAWTAPRILDGRDAQGQDTTDAGQFCDLAVDASDNVHIVYVDAVKDDLRYLNLSAGTSVVVDDGVRIQAGALSTNLVGQDAAILIDDAGQVRIAYQDATFHDLLLARANEAGSWDILTLAGDESAYAGAFGFYARHLGIGGQSVVVHFKYNRQVEPAANGVVLHRF